LFLYWLILEHLLKALHKLVSSISFL